MGDVRPVSMMPSTRPLTTYCTSCLLLFQRTAPTHLHEEVPPPAHIRPSQGARPLALPAHKSTPTGLISSLYAGQNVAASCMLDWRHIEESYKRVRTSCDWRGPARRPAGTAESDRPASLHHHTHSVSDWHIKTWQAGTCLRLTGYNDIQILDGISTACTQYDLGIINPDFPIVNGSRISGLGLILVGESLLLCISGLLLL